MRHLAPVLAAICLAATVAPAVADHDVPLDATLVKVDLVRAYAPCTAPNDVHDQIVVFAGACSPAAPLSPYRFGPGGRGRVQVQRVGSGIKFRVQLKDVRAIDDQPANGVDFTARIQLRITDDGCSAAPSCTFETFLGVGVPCAAGRCAGTVTYPSLFLPAGLEGGAEITLVDVLDDADNRFATAGIRLP